MSVASDNHRNVLKIKFDDDNAQLMKSVEELTNLKTLHGIDADLDDNEQENVIQESDYAEEVEIQTERIESEIESSLKIKEDLGKTKNFGSPIKKSLSNSMVMTEEVSVSEEIDRTVTRLRGK